MATTTTRATRATATASTGVYIAMGAIVAHARQAAQAAQAAAAKAATAARWGAVPAKGATAKAPSARKAFNKGPVYNGIAPLGMGKCRNVWAATAAHVMATGTMPTLAMVQEWGAAIGANATNTQIEYYRFRQYCGLGRK